MTMVNWARVGLASCVRLTSTGLAPCAVGHTQGCLVRAPGLTLRAKGGARVCIVCPNEGPSEHVQGWRSLCFFFFFFWIKLFQFLLPAMLLYITEDRECRIIPLVNYENVVSVNIYDKSLHKIIK